MATILNSSVGIYLESKAHLEQNIAKYQEYIDSEDFGDGVVEAMHDYYDKKLNMHKSSTATTIGSPEYKAFLDLLTETIFSYESYAEVFKVTPLQYRAAIDAVLRDFNIQDML